MLRSGAVLKYWFDEEQKNKYVLNNKVAIAWVFFDTLSESRHNKYDEFIAKTGKSHGNVTIIVDYCYLVLLCPEKSAPDTWHLM